MVLFSNYYGVFFFLMFFFRVASFLGKSCKLCLPSVHFVAVELYLSFRFV